MQCPYCHNELIEGHIQTRGEVIKWLPMTKRVPMLETRWNVRKEEIQLGKYNYFVGGDVSAYRCPNCHKIIIDYGEENDG